MKSCDQCNASRINGIFCHERECPNEKSQWDRDTEEWVKVCECVECGCNVRVGETCSCMEMDDLDEEEIESHENEFVELLEKEG